jgi:hypothetical protein
MPGAPRAAESVLAPVRTDPDPRKSVLPEKPKEPEPRRNPEEFADHDAEDELV